MAWRCVCRIYHPRSRSEEVCSRDKPRAKRGVYRGCKLPMTETEGGIFGILTDKPWFICYIPYCVGALLARAVLAGPRSRSSGEC